MGGPIDMEQKGFESIGCCTHIVTLNYESMTSSMTLTLEFQGQILKKS